MDRDPSVDPTAPGLIPDEPKNLGKTLFSANVILRVAETRVEDVGRAIARVAPADLVRIGARPGDVLQLAGRMSGVARAELADPQQAGAIQIDGTLRANCGAGINELVTVTRVEHSRAVAVRLGSLSDGAQSPPGDRLREDLAGVPVTAGCIVRAPTFAKALTFQVIRTIPDGPVVIDRRTDLRLLEGEAGAGQPPRISYEDIGGLQREVARVREVIELPLRHARVFERLGILPPKGVLLHGPPGTGKTLLARAVAAEARVHFIHLNGPDVMRKFYGESEAKLREVFDEAARHAPSIVFIDEIDAVAPKRTDVAGEVEKRVVAQLLALMDGFVARGQVVVIGATNIPEMLDPALRRPGRFDREIEIGVPDLQGRLEILRIHTRAMPLAPSVRLEDVASRTQGYVGADLEALCQEVGMVALRRYLSGGRLAAESDDAALARLQVEPGDFLTGLKEVEPSATREVFIEQSPHGFDALAGLDDIKRLLGGLADQVLGLDAEYERLGLAAPAGILLVGPSGTGKTSIVRGLAGERGLPLLAVDGPQLFSRWLGESERALREVFKKARRAAPCILFFDTIEAVAPHLSGAEISGATTAPQRIVTQLLREVDDLHDFKGVVLMAATSRLERVEPALLRGGRFDYVVPFGLPGVAEREAILRRTCLGMPLGADVELDALARRTESFTAADLQSLCKRAAILALDAQRRGARTALVIGDEDFRRAMGPPGAHTGSPTRSQP